MSATMADLLFAAGCVALTTGGAALAVWLMRRLWGQPEDSGEGGSTPDVEVLDALESHVMVLRRSTLLPVPHVGATEEPPAAGEIGTLAAAPSDDLLTFAESIRGADDEWAWYDRALVNYENAMLGLRRWPLGGAVADAYESVQQRIDRWLSEGGDGVRAARAETRQALSETWETTTSELAIVDRSDAEHVVVVLLAS